MSSLVSKPQQSTLDKETAMIFLKIAMFSRNPAFFSGFFETLIELKVASDVIRYVSQLRISMKEKTILKERRCEDGLCD